MSEYVGLDRWRPHTVGRGNCRGALESVLQSHIPTSTGTMETILTNHHSLQQDGVTEEDNDSLEV